MPNFCAIDPGLHGGIAFSLDGVTTAHPMPTKDLALVTLLADNPCDCYYLEQVGGYIGVEHPGSAMFTFGWAAGGPYWILRTLGRTVQMVPPQTWQRALKLVKQPSDTKTSWKRFLKETAAVTFPNLHITLHTSDALLILHAAVLGLL